MEKKYIATSKNSFEVYVIVDNEHMKAHDGVNNELIAEAVRLINYTPTFWMGSVDLHRLIGKDACVEVTPDDDVRWECRPGRSIKSPMVYGKKACDTSLLTVGMCTDDDGLVTVFTAFVGQKAPKEPNDPRLRDEERAEAESFWSKHALVAES